MPLKLRSTFDPFTITIDGEPVRLLFKRMTVDEYETFNAYFQAMGDGRLDVPPAPKDAPMAARLAAVDENAAQGQKNAAWMRDVFVAFVSVVQGDLLVDDAPVTDGAAFLAMFASRPEILSTVLMELWTENRLGDAQKKTWRLRRASATGSPTLPKDPSGPAPAAAATSAAPPSSAPNDAAAAPSPDPNPDPSSGTTARSSSAPVRSGS